MTPQDRSESARQSRPRQRRQVALVIRLLIAALFAVALAGGASYALRTLNL